VLLVLVVLSLHGVVEVVEVKREAEVVEVVVP
jgi:hypothetical protein